jgi:hypothetical protein
MTDNSSREGTMMRFLIFLLLFARLGAAENILSGKPTVSKAGAHHKITFALAKAADVEVAIVNAKGHVVRHLAAGVLGGKNAPPEPLKKGLSQALEWDGNDDFAKKAVGGPFKARVRAGTGVKFGRFIGGNDPYQLGSVNSIAADESGNLYIMGDGIGGKTLRAFDATGKYLRTLMPFPADLKPDGMKDIAAWNAEEKTFRPRQHKTLFPEFYMPADHLWASGNITIVSASAKNGVTMADVHQVYRIDTRGAVPGNQFILSGLWDPKKPVSNSGAGPVFLAGSPDGKYLYLSGPYSTTTEYGYVADPSFPPGQIYRLEIGKGTMQPFAKTETNGGYQPSAVGWHNKHSNLENVLHSHGPVHQVAVDKDGMVLVADRDNQCIQVFDSSGKPCGKLAVDYPDLISLHPKTGELYVLSKGPANEYWNLPLKKLHKFSGWKNGKLLASHDLGKHGVRAQIAVVVGAKTVVWVYGTGQGGSGLIALEDKGSSFAPMQNSFAPKGVQDGFARMAVDSDREELYVQDGGAGVCRYNGETGEITGSLTAGDVTVGYDGLVYARTAANHNGPFERFDHEFKPAPFKETGTHVLSPFIYGRMGVGYADRGIGVGPDGKIYFSWMFPGWVNYAVTAWGPDGKPVKGKYLEGKGHPSHYQSGLNKDITSAVIGPIIQANGGIRVDLKGNIYLGLLAWPKDVPYPKEFDLPGVEVHNNAYKSSVGSVVKFTSDGGFMADMPDSNLMNKLPRTGAKGIDTTQGYVEGAVAAYPGLGPFSQWGYGGNTCCVCRGPRFDLDRYGRIVMPNAVSNSVTMVDNAGNEILTFGAYGNFDSQYVHDGAKDAKPNLAFPEIPLAWPVGAGVSEKYVYVLDYYNRRAVRADLTWKSEETCPIK